MKELSKKEHKFSFQAFTQEIGGGVRGTMTQLSQFMRFSLIAHGSSRDSDKSTQTQNLDRDLISYTYRGGS